MNTLVRSNVIAYRRRYTAVIAAITIGVAFLTATLFVGTSMRATLAASIGQDYQRADLVASLDSSEGLTDSAAAAAKLHRQARATHGVDQALVTSTTTGELRTGSGSVYSSVTVTDGSPGLFGMQLIKGRAGEAGITLNQATVDSKHLKIGDELTLTVQGQNGEHQHRFTLTGITEDPQSPDGAGLAAVQMSAPTARDAGVIAAPTRLLVSADPGTDLATLGTDLSAVVGHVGLGHPAVQTPDQAVDATVKDFSGGTAALTWVLGAFAGIALVVTVIVVANTFSVILAQRTRELALLRTLGAKRGQVRSMVTGEAAVIGLIGGIIGILLGTGVVWGGTLVLAAALDLPYVSFGPAWWPPVVGLLVGIVVTLLAASRPARAATRVAPLAALRPHDTVTVRSRRGLGRIISGAVLALIGAALLVAGVAGAGGYGLAFGLAFLGGLISFIGVLLLGTLLVPWAVRQLARPFGGNVAGRLSGLNAVRHPQRTAAIGTALLLGVTLVAMMLVGAQAARSTLNTELAKTMPVDLQVTASGSGHQIGSKQAEAVHRVQGIAEVTVLPVVSTSGCESDDACTPVYAAQADALESVLTEGAHAPSDGHVAAGENALPDGATKVTLQGQDGQAVTVPVDADATAPESTLLMTSDTATELHLDAPSKAEAASAGGSALWIKANDSVSAGTLLNDVATAADVSSSDVSGALPIRQAASQIIDTLLLVVSALLAVAVVIALIGVSNTLSLSVIERTRENSLLRALGLTKKQLRRMLALEAALIAGAATVLGLILGGIYGLAGAKAATLGIGGFTAALPWGWIVVVLIVAIGAAVLASVWPARRATRLSPVEGLAVE